jgi:hypothetical protein
VGADRDLAGTGKRRHGRRHSSGGCRGPLLTEARTVLGIQERLDQPIPSSGRHGEEIDALIESHLPNDLLTRLHERS